MGSQVVARGDATTQLLAAVGNKTGATRLGLGFAISLKCLHYVGRFPRSRAEVAPDVVRFLAVQVGVDATLFAQYAWEGRTIEAHRAQIREMAKMREFHHADEEALLDWLCTEVFDHEQHPDRLSDLIRAECRTRALEAPNDIAALIDTGLMAYEAQIYTVIVARLTPDVQNRLDALLAASSVAKGEEEEELPLSLMRRDPGPVGVESAMSEIANCNRCAPSDCHLSCLRGIRRCWSSDCNDALPPNPLRIFASIPTLFA